MKNEIIPRLRFKGFNNEWLIKLVNELAPIRGGYSFKSDKFLKVGIPIIRISNINKNIISGKFKYYPKLNNLNKFKLMNGAILIAMSGATAGKVAMLHSHRIFYQNQRVGYFKTLPKIDNNFFYLLLQTNRFYFNLKKIEIPSHPQPNLSSKNLNHFKFFIPSLPEQQLIGKFFAKLDKLIQLQQKKVALLKKLKRGYLQKLFPRKGESVPRLRFKGFCDKWTLINLGDISKITKFDGPAFMDFMKYSSSGKYIALRGLNVVNNSINLKGAKYVNEEKSNFSKLDKLNKGDIVFRYVGNVGPSAVINKNNKYYLAPNLALIRITTNDNPLFIHQLISTSYYYKEFIFPYINNSSRLDLNMKLISNFKLRIPSIQEQSCVGNLLEKFDKVLNYQNDIINHLRKLKKAYLQKMFC